MEKNLKQSKWSNIEKVKAPRFWRKIKRIRQVKCDQQGDVEKEKAPGHLFGDIADETHLVQRQLVLSCRALHTFNEDIVLNFSEKHNCDKNEKHDDYETCIIAVRMTNMRFMRIMKPA